MSQLNVKNKKEQSCVFQKIAINYECHLSKQNYLFNFYIGGIKIWYGLWFRFCLIIGWLVSGVTL